MTYDEQLAQRVRGQLSGVKRLTEREMFGGLTFMVGGHMCCGVLDDDLVARVPPDLHQDALTRPHVRPLEFGSRSSRGVVRVGPDGIAGDNDLALWVRLGVTHAQSLPPKKAAKKKAPARKKTAPATKKAPARKKAAPATRKAAAEKKAAAGKKGAPATKKAAARKAAAATKKAPRATKGPATTTKASARRR